MGSNRFQQNELCFSAIGASGKTGNLHNIYIKRIVTGISPVSEPLEMNKIFMDCFSALAHYYGVLDINSEINQLMSH